MAGTLAWWWGGLLWDFGFGWLIWVCGAVDGGGLTGCLL